MPPDSSTCDVELADHRGEQVAVASRGRTRRRGRRGGSTRRRPPARRARRPAGRRSRSRCRPRPARGGRPGRRRRRRRAAARASGAVGHRVGLRSKIMTVSTGHASTVRTSGGTAQPPRAGQQPQHDVRAVSTASSTPSCGRGRRPSAARGLRRDGRAPLHARTGAVTGPAARGAGGAALAGAPAAGRALALARGGGLALGPAPGAFLAHGSPARRSRLTSGADPVARAAARRRRRTSPGGTGSPTAARSRPRRRTARRARPR